MLFVAQLAMYGALVVLFRLTEHEFDHVFIGQFDGSPAPNPEEVGGFGSADRSDLITARYKRLACSVTMPPHDALLAPALTEVGSG